MKMFRLAVPLALALLAGCGGASRTAVVPESLPPELVARGGKICGNSQLFGEPTADIPGRLPGCGLKDGVKVFAVSGVALSRPASMTCETADALDIWVRKGLKPAVGSRGGGVQEIQVAAHYVCRTRNHRRGAPISEHGKGKAIDISAISLNNGDQLSVSRDWGPGRDGSILRQAYRKACGPFGTTLGPDSDRYHQSHFHFDTARHRGGPVCR